MQGKSEEEMQQVIEDAYRSHYRKYRQALTKRQPYDQARHLGAMSIHKERLMNQYGYKEEDLQRIRKEEQEKS